jgi:starch-binding outer membrane protein, SusD/RagB family
MIAMIHACGARARITLCAAFLAAAGCDLDTVLTVDDREVATPTTLEGLPGLPVVLAGAKADFQVAFSGGPNEGQVNMVGLFTDELHYGSTFNTRIEVDRREIQSTNSTMEPIHRFLHRARALAEISAERHAELRPNSEGHAESLNLYAYTLILFAENYCSGVPLSRMTTTGGVEYGDPQTTQQLLEGAVVAFDQALQAATAAGSTMQSNLARIGKGRALLNLGRFADAKAAVDAVPTSFVYWIYHSENSVRQENGSYVYQFVGRRWSVADREGTNGLPFRSAMDPRVPWQESPTAVSFDNSPLWLSLKYTSRSAPTALATGVEARLIEAEADLQAGSANWLTTLNALRAAPPAAIYPLTDYPGIDGLAALADPGTDAARVDLLFRERAMWLYLTSHRLGDLRRLIRQYGRSAATVFPTGEWGVWTPDKAGDYGTDVNFIIPFDEQNNPNFTGCLSRDA